jgi:1-acyl-sn-glycerol-3-phosphate acyltransferase
VRGVGGGGARACGGGEGESSPVGCLWYPQPLLGQAGDKTGERLKHGQRGGGRQQGQGSGGFKQGAFSVAVNAGVPVVPITLIGTGGSYWVRTRGECWV